MSEKEKIYIFDDGSIASRLLQHELKDKYEIKVVGVNVSDTVYEWFTKINADRKIHLHCTYEQLIADNEKLRKEIKKAESLGFTNLIFLDYEGLDEKTLNYRAKVAGIKEDIKLTGKPEAIALVDPDDEMKDNVVGSEGLVDEVNDDTDKTSNTRKFSKKFVRDL